MGDKKFANALSMQRLSTMETNKLTPKNSQMTIGGETKLDPKYLRGQFDDKMSH